MVREWWWVSSPKMTGGVLLDGDIIVGSAPIFRRFIGQPATNLGRWMRTHGGEFRQERIGAQEVPKDAV